ncbi:glycosyltransferase family 2 protein [Microtetraspora sp. AC03309]|uniref:glycosyltransferase family 2 protein n=1 Tax=Microtetraspora sp. AC03309 TaxID=2779376 RepID=UPI001E590A83|nr:glycosyltransferase [Microtetraspora sp. AC03309]MCC5581594.1 glycosyltransferase family 2 protein [Microtetraspora sp. AC03309]
MTSPTRQPRIPANDHGVIEGVPALGEWTPRLSVSVVIPTSGSRGTLPLALAGLAAQTYPRHLLEVIVVDDGEQPMLRLPEIRPERTRLIRPKDGRWGKPHACNLGASTAEGDVVHWLDDDLVLFPDHVEAQMRWHHLADYLVVLGHPRFVGPDPSELSPNEVLAAAEAGAVAKLFHEEDSTPQWTEKRWNRTSDLRTAGVDAFSVHVGATSSLPAALFRAVGGMDESLMLGEDTELGYRLAQAGAVFVPDRAARAWHLGRSTVTGREPEVKRHNWPYLGERVPTFRWLRKTPGRGYRVPYVEVVVDARGASLEEVRATVDGALGSWTPDVSVRITGPWSRLGDGRRVPLDDPDLDLRLISAGYEGDARVTFTEDLPESCFPIPFRFHCPAGWVPGQDALGRLIAFADRNALGVLSLALEERDEVVHARLERTAALSRARLVADPGEDLDDVVHEVFGTLWDVGEKWGVVRSESATTVSPETLQAELEKCRARSLVLQDRANRWRRQATRGHATRTRWRHASRRVARVLMRRVARPVMRRVARPVGLRMPWAAPGRGRL